MMRFVKGGEETIQPRQVCFLFLFSYVCMSKDLDSLLTWPFTKGPSIDSKRETTGTRRVD